MKPSRILLIIDDPITKQLIRFPLEREAHTLSIASSPKQAFKQLKKNGLPHFVISATQFSTKMDGFQFCQKLHKFCAVPVLLLVSEKDAADQSFMARVLKYAQGCLIKSDAKALTPSQIQTAVTQLEAQYGRFPYPPHTITHLNNSLSIHFTHRLSFINGHPIRLTPTENKLLYILIHHLNQTISTADLLQRLWPHEAASEERLHTHIYRLRKKIEPDHTTPSYILSEWNVGYRLTTPSNEPITQLGHVTDK